MATEAKAYDAGHFSFLQIIKVVAEIAGPAFIQGALIKTGVSAAKQADMQEFDSLDDFLASIDTLDNAIAKFEGRAVHYGNGVFGLPGCPFAESIKTYKSVTGGLPAEYNEITERLNSASAMSEKLRVGEGAAVSPFCGVHQPIRSAFGSKVRVAGHELKVYQLGCKSGSGFKGLAKERIEEVGIDPAEVEKILDNNMCCYCIRFDAD